MTQQVDHCKDRERERAPLEGLQMQAWEDKLDVPRRN